MTNVSPPPYACNVIDVLTRAGFKAYLVGGCVRDSIIGRPVRDWDVATSAAPGQVTALFAGAVPTGVKYGTVTVVDGGGRVEVTTMRADGEYGDRRRPESVEYVDDIAADLSRRDFTMNALAISPGGEIIDPFGGREDIRRGVIRSVGEPARRFGEDALRMLRALRFSAELGFAVERATREAMERLSFHCESLSRERVRDELEKTIMSDRPAVAAEMARLGLLEPSAARGASDVSRLNDVARERHARWAALAEALCRARLIKSPRTFLLELRLDGESMRACSLAINAMMETFADRRRVKRLIAEYGADVALLAAAISRDGTAPDAVRAVLDSGECCTREALAINGDDLIELGFKPSRRLGQTLDIMLDHVIDCPADNTRERLRQIALIFI